MPYASRETLLFATRLGAGIGGTPTPTPVPTPTPSVPTHNGVTPADMTYTVTNKSELDQAINAFVAGTGSNVIALRGPLAGSTAEAYTQGTGSYVAPGVTLPSQLEIRSAKFGDKAEFNLVSSSNLSARRCFQPISNSLWNGLRWNIDFEPADFQIVLYGGYDNVKLRNIYARSTNPRAKPPNCRLMDLRGGTGNALEYSIVAGMACGIAITDLVDTTVQNNSFLYFGEHAVKGVRSHTNTLIKRNWFDNPNPGYSGTAYLDHANAAYIGGAFTDVVDNCQLIDNTLLSYVDQAHARMIGVAWNDGNGTGGSAPDPANMKNLLLDNNRSFGGLVNTIGIYAAGGVNNKVRNTHFYRILELLESSNALNLTLDTCTLSQYDNNIADLLKTAGSVPTGTGNAVSDTIATILAARAAAEAIAAGYGLQTSATLGL